MNSGRSAEQECFKEAGYVLLLSAFLVGFVLRSHGEDAKYPARPGTEVFNWHLNEIARLRENRSVPSQSETTHSCPVLTVVRKLHARRAVFVASKEGRDTTNQGWQASLARSKGLLRPHPGHVYASFLALFTGRPRGQEQQIDHPSLVPVAEPIEEKGGGSSGTASSFGLSGELRGEPSQDSTDVC
ncbi:hypothetical protein MKZ38_000446 [Zalerion maritima]|uniref:Transmembrane protein n=1 Tax=Zalerion maritima TaxID=339359 RepID=A0AAD5S012_9PEZI|nr:hypothetical protein MKZ38_000446 [Zalerion maritima]